MSHSERIQRTIPSWSNTLSPPKKTKETLPCAGLLLYVHKSKHTKVSTVIGADFFVLGLI